MPNGALAGIHDRDIDQQPISGILSDTLMSGAAIRLSVPNSASVGSRPVIGRIVLIAFVLAFGAGSLRAGQNKPNKHENRNEIYQLEEVWRNAMLKADTSAMSNLLADDYIAITSAGTLQTKTDAINNLRTHRSHVIALVNVADRTRYASTRKHRRRLPPSSAVQTHTPDGDVSGSFRYTRVYVRDTQDKWKIVSFEASRMRQPRRAPPAAGQLRAVVRQAIFLYRAHSATPLLRQEFHIIICSEGSRPAPAELEMRESGVISVAGTRFGDESVVRPNGFGVDHSEECWSQPQGWKTPKKT